MGILNDVFASQQPIALKREIVCPFRDDNTKAGGICVGGAICIRCQYYIRSTFLESMDCVMCVSPDRWDKFEFIGVGGVSNGNP